jgi:hypothetical protein
VADLGDCSFLMLRNHRLLMARAPSGGGGWAPVHAQVTVNVRAQAADVTRGIGAGLTWPALLQRRDRRLPGYDA